MAEEGRALGPRAHGEDKIVWMVMSGSSVCMAVKGKVKDLDS